MAAAHTATRLTHTYAPASTLFDVSGICSSSTGSTRPSLHPPDAVAVSSADDSDHVADAGAGRRAAELGHHVLVALVYEWTHHGRERVGHLAESLRDDV